ncbi:hypothetical protein H0H81_009620 [Sphagnurus paluster]|uniref:Putative lipoate-protein ligase A n=1 Tax=Sphagnurus paluster TaxID=117069 RepID=A0A9P7FVB6_9AGAR|nr:hypothetical protein H0H81_009620 [Sphagnurus paluster]
MSTIQAGSVENKPYIDPTPLPDHIPKVAELGVTSAPLKSAAFFIGAYCKEYNEDFMLCKAENRNPEHCLKEGRRVTRCATDLITKMRQNCLQQFEAHWSCLEKNNQACRVPLTPMPGHYSPRAGILPLSQTGTNSQRMHVRETIHLRTIVSPAYATPSAQHSIYISKSTNPYFNLTFEDWLFRHKSPEEPLLLIYRDEPCVIIGRNQNPWKEVNFEALRARPNIPFIRRRSGGGTVYHDLGNTNFSIHLPRQEFDRHVTAQLVLRAVRSLGVNAQVNDRNDICTLLICGFHVSGSAYKIVNKRAYHHGTMLISSRLDTLGDLLRTNKDTMVTKGVASVRSPVRNLQHFRRDVTHDTFTSAVVNEFQREYGISASPQFIEETGDIKNVEYIRKGLDELPVLDTPLEKSVLEDLMRSGQTLVGKQYGLLEESLTELKRDDPRRELISWIKATIET